MRNKGLFWSSVVAGLLLLVLASAAQADDYLPTIGGGGGGKFEAHCPPGQLLAGFDLRAGDDVDAIRPLCVTARGPRDTSEPAAETTWYGGSGGGPARVVCNRYNPVVTGMFVAYEGEETIIVNNIHLYCGDTANTQPQNDSAAAMFDAPAIDGGAPPFQTFHQGYEITQHCPPGQPATGLHGRSGKWVDAIGLICGPAPPRPSSDPSVVGSIGRIDTGAPSSPRPPQSICASARDARARNSPAAPTLEAQCLASRMRSTTSATRGAVMSSDTNLPTSAPAPPNAPAFLYTIGSDGRLRWFRHDGAQPSPSDWTGPRLVDTGWQNNKQVFAGGDGVVYAITSAGILMRYQHTGIASGSAKNEGGWAPPQALASGWGGIVQAFSAGHGVIYAVTADGTLTWYRHTGFANGKATLEGPKKVGHGWNGLKIFSGGDGVMYTIAPDGTLRWYRQIAFLTGGALETPGAWAARREVGNGWNDFAQVFSAGNGNIYAVTNDGAVRWYRHRGYRDGANSWDPPRTVANGWGGLRTAFAQP
jgi:hypothetical protein